MSAAVDEMVAEPVSARLRLALRAKGPVGARVAVPMDTGPAVGDAGGVPRAASAAIERVPALSVVAPLSVLTPDRVRVPVPVLVRASWPLPSPSTPE